MGIWRVEAWISKCTNSSMDFYGKPWAISIYQLLTSHLLKEVVRKTWSHLCLMDWGVISRREKIPSLSGDLALKSNSILNVWLFLDCVLLLLSSFNRWCRSLYSRIRASEAARTGRLLLYVLSEVEAHQPAICNQGAWFGRSELRLALPCWAITRTPLYPRPSFYSWLLQCFLWLRSLYLHGSRMVCQGWSLRGHLFKIEKPSLRRHNSSLHSTTRRSSGLSPLVINSPLRYKARKYFHSGRWVPKTGRFRMCHFLFIKYHQQVINRDSRLLLSLTQTTLSRQALILFSGCLGCVGYWGSGLRNVESFEI